MKLFKNHAFKLAFVALASVFVMSSCDELTENTKQTINFNADDLHFSIDSVIFTQNKAANANVDVFNEIIDLGDALSSTDYSVDDIKNISLKKATLVVEVPQGLDVTMFMGTTFHLGEGQTKVAEITGVDAGAQSVTFSIIDGDILSYINENDEIQVMIMMDENTTLPTPTVDLILQTAYQAEVQIL
ncbi:MAG TPA: hypothetical protein VJ939_06745 [Bacteroidales bacterium]|nr:hypothetical protein [Bacteroidales bacterium]